MIIATFNCNSIRSRMEIVLAWLAQHQPDVLCLQETKVQDEEFPAEPIRAAGWQVAFRGQKAYNGVALISRKPLADVGFGLDSEPRDESRLIHARLGKLRVINTYVPQGREVDHEMYGYKLKWFGRLRALFDQRFKSTDLVAWCGDLNVARTAIDVHNPGERGHHVCYHIDARNALEQCIAWGYEDVFRKHHPEPGQYSFFDYRTPKAAERGLGWRLDYILASPPLAKRSTNASIDLAPRMQTKSSDHTFVTAEFDL